MQKEILLDQVTLCADGSVGIKLFKRVLNDDGSVLFSEPHRTSVDVLVEVNDQVALVNSHLEQMGFPHVPDSATAMVTKLVKLHRADPAVKARRELVKSNRSALAAQVASG
ncbi:hypothetical protein [Mesorhizobium sp. M0715]|uniref:hypothetical protein n=1 Tax=Mesorhizobium sp. M0715 TaxID=2956990 RepID=UPI003337DEE6